MITLGQTLYLWRLEHRLTQAELARRCGISRPNLSGIENGARDITVETLRRLAKALGVSAGILADGIPPKKKYSKRLSRESLDQIAHVLVGDRKTKDARERDLVQMLEPLIKRKLGRTKEYGRHLPRTVRDENTALLKVKTNLTPDEFKSILNRVDKILSVSR